VDFVKVHSEAVSSVMFSADGALVLSGSHDTTARIHGLKSGKTLKEFRGHTSFVNDAKFSADGDTLVTAGSDGSVKVRGSKGVIHVTAEWRSYFACVGVAVTALGRSYHGVLQDHGAPTTEPSD
jgi:WD40 repeat protein